MNRLAALTNAIMGMLLLVAAPAAFAATQHTKELRFDANQIQLLDANGAVRVVYGNVPSQAPAGSPDLFHSIVWIDVPIGYRVTEVDVEAFDIVDLGRHQIAAVQPDVQPGDEVVELSLSPDLRGLQPALWAEVGLQGSMRGHRLAALRVCPVRWNVDTGELVMASSMRLRYTLEADPTAAPLARKRIVRSIEERFERTLGKLVPDYQPLAARGVQGGDVAGPGPFQPTFRPTEDGSPIEHVIITSDALAPEFERLADFKTRKGVQSTVRTIEWIDQTYPNGADRAERVRFFIRDAYQNWGTLFALLGGDTDVIPPRYAVTTAPEDETIPADMYYGCLEGNWNGDHDDKWGEGKTANDDGDEADPFFVDFLFEVSIGRAPVSTLAEAEVFVDKLLLYEQDPPSDADYPASALALAERLFESIHGAETAEQAFALLPPWFNQVKLYEESESYPGSIELDAETAIDSLNSGFGLVLHVGHGFRNTMSVGDGSLNNEDIDALFNGPRNSLTFAVNCSSASIDFNSIGERWLKNPDGGSIIYIGTSRQAYVSPATTYTVEWFSLVFEDSVATVGLSVDMARAVLASSAEFDGITRSNLCATTLLGDPEVDLYLNEVVDLDVSHPGSIELGQSPVSVTVTNDGSPVENASVTLVKEGESYGLASTNASGLASVPFAPETAGNATLTVHKGYYRVAQASIPVASTPGVFIHINGSSIDDDNTGASSGDDDGLADAGETVELAITLRNGGGQSATGVFATLTAVDPENALNITSNTVIYGTISTGASSSGTGTYVIEIDPSSPVAYQPVLDLSIQSDQGNRDDVLTLPIRRPFIEHYGHTIDDSTPRGNGDGMIEAGEEIWYTVSLRNSGQHELSSVSATLQALRASDMQPNPDVTVLDGTSSFGGIDVGEVQSGDRFEFSLSGGANVSDVLLEITTSAPPFADVVNLLDVVGPGSPDSVRAFGTPNSIILKWTPPIDGDVAGYDVKRAPNPFTPYVRINNYTVEGSAVFEDSGLPPFTRFYYQVVARDSSYNASPESAIIAATTNPPLHPGWPLEVPQQSSSSVTIVDIDGDFHNEILVGADTQYAWHCDATEVVDGDDDGRTNGPFSVRGKDVNAGFSATQAVGDMDRDGIIEIANVGWTVDTLYVWQPDGTIKPGWPKHVLDDLNWGSPVMADLDQDGDLEIVLWTAKGGRLFGWHHDGSEIVDGDNNPATDGIITRIFDNSFNYGGAAVGNLDGDSDLEIVVPINFSGDNSGGIYAVNIDGTIVSGWPFFTGDGSGSQVSATPAVADLDKNGDMEVIIAAERQGGRVYVLNHDGTEFPGWPQQVASVTATARLPSPVVADIDNDTFLDVIFTATDGQLYVWDRNGALHSGFPVEFLDIASQNTEGTPAIADIDDDGRPEILFGDESNKVNAFNHDGTLVVGFPIQTNGEVRSTPAIWDCDRDGLVEVAVLSYDGNVYVWDLQGQFHHDRTPWPQWAHDTRNTGLVTSPILPIGVVDSGPDASPPPAQMAIHPAVPNPFNPRTLLRFDVPGEAGGSRLVELRIFDVQGRSIRHLVDAPIETGSHAITWDGRVDRGGAAPSGVYFAQLKVGNAVATRKLVIVR